MSAKKIVCLIEDLNSGGAERQLSGLAVLLKQHGYDVEVWTYYPGDFYLHDLVDAGVKYRYIVRAQNPFNRIPVLKKELNKHRPDTVIAYLDTACIVACIIKLAGGKFNLIVSERNTTQRLTARERIKFYLYRFADTIVCNSFSQGKYIQNNYLNIANKIKVITNMVDFNKFYPNEYTHSNINNESFIPQVITTARIATQKNVINYLEALAILRKDGVKAQFNWFGCPESQQYLDEVLAKQHNLGLDDYIKFHVGGTKNIEEVYRSHTHFCLPSIYEGFPNVLCEAMASGLVCTASNICDNPIILEDPDFMFDPASPYEMAKTIKKSLLLTSSKCNIVSIKNRKIVKDLCSMDLFIQKYINLINS